MPALAQGDPLPSWNDGPAKSAILDFVKRVTTDGGPEMVPQADRIAVFDNDGTLWSEQPAYFQGMFVFDRIKAMAPSIRSGNRSSRSRRRWRAISGRWPPAAWPRSTSC